MKHDVAKVGYDEKNSETVIECVCGRVFQNKDWVRISDEWDAHELEEVA